MNVDKPNYTLCFFSKKDNDSHQYNNHSLNDINGLF